MTHLEMIKRAQKDLKQIEDLVRRTSDDAIVGAKLENLLEVLADIGESLEE